MSVLIIAYHGMYIFGGHTNGMPVHKCDLNTIPICPKITGNFEVNNVVRKLLIFRYISICIYEVYLYLVRIIRLAFANFSNTTRRAVRWLDFTASYYLWR